MSQVRTVGSRLLGLAMAALLAAVMAASFAVLPSKAYAADDQGVRAAANSVLKFNWTLDDKDYSRGSCFLINDSTVLTAYHCTMFSSLEIELMEVELGHEIRVPDLRDRMTYSVTINRDVKVGATLVNYSEEQDFAILKLDQPINGYKPLPIRDSSKVEAAETVYSVGFPANSDLTVINTYTASDVTFKRGTVSKPENIYQGWMDFFEVNGYFIQTDCPISGGDSGGPMLDADGNVVGISVMGNDEDRFYFAVASDKVTTVLDTLGIDWTPSPGPNPGPPDPGPGDITYELNYDHLEAAIKDATSRNDSSKYTPESFEALTAALNAANEVRGLKLEDNTDKAEYDEKQGQIDKARDDLLDAIKSLEEPEPGPNMALIIGIIAAVVVIIAIVVIILVMRGRKKKTQEQPAPNTPLVPINNAVETASPSKVTWQAAPSKGSSDATAVLAEDTAATTVLTEESSDTILLFQSANGGSLTRMSNNDVVPINSAEFTIGRERSAVDYCIEDDSVTRVHARFVVRDGKTYVIDNKSSNGTMVNNVKCRPGQEVQLKNGDIVTISKEKFRYNN